VVVVPGAIGCCGVAEVNPPQLLLSDGEGAATVPCEPKANVTELGSDVVAAVVVAVIVGVGLRVPVKLSDAIPLTGQKGGPAIGEVPESVIVPVKDELEVFVTVRNPVSGPVRLVQIVPLVLHVATKVAAGNPLQPPLQI